MGRARTFNVSAINVAMHRHSPRRYVDLFQRLARMRTGVKIRGEYQAMISSATEIRPDRPEEGITGEIYKFFELDPKAAWYNVVRQKAAEPEERSKIQIPADLKPHLSIFYYVFFPKGHRFFYESRFGQSQLSPGLAARMLEQLFERTAIARDFGPIGVTPEPDVDTLDRIFRMPKMRRLRIELTRPNADDLASARRKFMERLQAINAESQAIEFKAVSGEGLQPDEDIKVAAAVAQSNGSVEAEGISEDGKTRYESTAAHPLEEPVSYDPDVEGHREKLIEKSRDLLPMLLNREKATDSQDE